VGESFVDGDTVILVDDVIAHLQTLEQVIAEQLAPGAAHQGAATGRGPAKDLGVRHEGQAGLGAGPSATGQPAG
jgi:hypothetical protein